MIATSILFKSLSPVDIFEPGNSGEKFSIALSRFLNFVFGSKEYLLIYSAFCASSLSGLIVLLILLAPNKATIRDII